MSDEPNQIELPIDSPIDLRDPSPDFVRPGRGRKHVIERDLPPWHEEFCQRLRSLRLMRGLPGTEVVRRISQNGYKMTGAMLSRYESGESAPSLVNILKICQVYEVDPGVLLKGLSLDFEGEQP